MAGRGPMGDSSLLSGVDTSPLYAYFGGANRATDALGGLSKTLNNYGKAKASDATAQAIAAITGADSRDAYSQLNAEQLASDGWLSGEQKLDIMNKYKAQEEVARANDIQKLQQSLYGQLGTDPEQIRNNASSADFNANAMRQLIEANANGDELSKFQQGIGSLGTSFREQEELAQKRKLQEAGESALLELANHPQGVEGAIKDPKIVFDTISKYIQNGGGLEGASKLQKDLLGLNTAAREQEKTVLNTRHENIQKTLDSILLGDSLAKYSSGKEASKAVLGGMDLEGIPKAYQDKYHQLVAETYESKYGLTPEQQTRKEILSAENAALNKVAADQQRQMFSDELVKQGYSKQFADARMLDPAKDMTDRDVVVELEKRYTSDADIDVIRDMREMAKAEGVSLNSRDLLYMYELGATNDWTTYRGDGVVKDFSWNSTSKTKAKDYIQQIKQFNNSGVAGTYGNFNARNEAAQKLLSLEQGRNIDAQFNALNRGLTTALPGSADVDNIAQETGNYAGTQKYINALRQGSSN